MKWIISKISNDYKAQILKISPINSKEIKI